MSNEDRERWDERYRKGAYVDREHPSALLESWLPDIPRGHALDIPCGAGRNSIFLALNGFSVVGVDISTVALKRAAESASARGVEIDWHERDLDKRLNIVGAFDLIVVIHYVDLGLITSLSSMLNPGGYVIVEMHLETDEEVIGPSDPAFRVSPGALRDAAADLDMVNYSEALVAEADGRVAALARMVARSTNGSK